MICWTPWYIVLGVIIPLGSKYHMTPVFNSENNTNKAIWNTECPCYENKMIRLLFLMDFLVILIIIYYFLKIDLQAVIGFSLYIKRTKHKNVWASFVYILFNYWFCGISRSISGLISWHFSQENIFSIIGRIMYVCFKWKWVFKVFACHKVYTV